MNTLDIKQLLPELKKQVTLLAEDLLIRAKADAKISDGLKEAFQQIQKGGRTAQAYEVWLEDYLDQVAVAWVLSCVFVRFMEDNELIDECWLAGDDDRRQLAEDAHTLFFREHPRDSDREYFQHVFREVGKIPAAKDLFAEGKTPLWAIAPSGDAAMKLLKFWREMDAETGHLKRSFQVESVDTRFLGDLYQELSERAKKKFALLQTPVFVEEFILDRTLTPALAEFGLEKVRMIDPTCGSGHFLLGGFARLFDLWSRPDHTTGNAEKDAQNALDGVWGVDINPFAVAIARFRLVVAAVHACGIKRLKKAPGWNIHLASGDSLLFGSKPTFGGERVGISQQMSLFEVPAIYAVEDRKTLQQILGQGYHVVVGNPPYITVKDKSQNAAYRGLYSTCFRKYSLGVPFTQRFIELGIQIRDQANGRTEAAAYIGMITTNAFMKRVFGKKLIEQFLAKVDLTHVIDTSGAYIPGHGTPTVVLLGRSRQPVAETIRAVLGIKGEPGTPTDAAQGFVWQSILRNVDAVGSQDEFTSSADLPRSTFRVHPWSIGGGGAAELKEQIDEDASGKLKDIVKSIGFACIIGEDEAFSSSASSHCFDGLPTNALKNSIEGDHIRDWTVTRTTPVLFPYDAKIQLRNDPALLDYLWPYRTVLSNRRDFGNRTYAASGRPFWEYHQIPTDKFSSQNALAFAEIATHNHFVFDRNVNLFKHSAQIIKLKDSATDSDHIGLLGLLNCSTACFWMKQTFHNKGSTVDQHGARQRTDPFEDFYDHTGTGLKGFPLPDGESPLTLASQLDDLARQRASYLPESVCRAELPDSTNLASNHSQADRILALMIALQEELDWHCYSLYGLIPQNDTEPIFIEGLQVLTKDFEGLKLGQRAFEIVMARQMAKGELETSWFERHGSTPITEVPSHWPVDYRKLVERRIKLIETNKEIALVEKPEYKRRWNTEPWDEQQQRALKNWLLDRLETPKYRKGTEDHPELTTTAQMADVASADEKFLKVAALYRNRSDFDVAALVAELVEAEAVPLLPILRYKPEGLRKRNIWERTWTLQRQQDVGKDVGDIPVPPKYTNSSGKADFLKPDYWRLRGSLDVPKERWVSYPHCSTDSDPTLVVGWAGWNHLEQATALTAYYDARKREGWDARRLTPLLTGLDQLLPWIHQWHPEIDANFSETAGQSFQTLLESDAHELGLTLEAIRNWTPPAKQPNTTKKPTKKAKKQS